MLRPYVAAPDPRHPGAADPAPVQHAQVHSRFFRHARRLEPAPLEADGRALRPAPQRVRSALPVRAPAGEIEHPLDHVVEGTSPPISAASIRTCGAPSVTASGYWPPLPQPPPIWFHWKSPATWSMRSSVWNRLPASTTSFTISATCPSRIMCP